MNTMLPGTLDLISCGSLEMKQSLLKHSHSSQLLPPSRRPSRHLGLQRQPTDSLHINSQQLHHINSLSKDRILTNSLRPTLSRLLTNTSPWHSISQSSRSFPTKTSPS